MSAVSCAICIDGTKSLIPCPKCATHVCAACQAQFGRPACAACAAALSRTVFARHAPKLVKSVFQPFHEAALWDREKALLPATQALVDWERETTELRKQLRFGLRPAFPPKPAVLLSSSASAAFPCPSIECRGFVMDGSACGTCGMQVCHGCREQKQPEHVCNPDVLRSIAQIDAETKPCPKCTTRIFRTQGCNHMFCTACRTHFDYATAQILSSSTNHHYDATATFAHNIATLRTEADTCPSDVSIHAVPRPARTGDAELERALWIESTTVRHLLTSMFDALKLQRAHDEALIQARMKFLRGDTTEAQARARVFQLESALHKRQDVASVLTLFLSVVNDLQRAWRAGSYSTDTAATLSPAIDGLVGACNASLAAIATEYGGSVPRFQEAWRGSAFPIVALSGTS